MKETATWAFWILGSLGVISSMIASIWPVHMVVWAKNSKRARLAMKVLTATGLMGWWVIFSSAAQELGVDEEWESALIGPIMLGLISVFYSAITRGEELARLKGEITEDKYRYLRFVKKNASFEMPPPPYRGPGRDDWGNKL